MVKWQGETGNFIRMGVFPNPLLASYEAILLSEDKSVKLVQLLGRVRQDWRRSDHS